MKFELGEVLEDKITKFKGVVLGRTEYFTECIQYGLCSQSFKDGKPLKLDLFDKIRLMELEWFDETRLVKVKGFKNVFLYSR